MHFDQVYFVLVSARTSSKREKLLAKKEPTKRQGNHACESVHHLKRLEQVGQTLPQDARRVKSSNLPETGVWRPCGGMVSSPA